MKVFLKDSLTTSVNAFCLDDFGQYLDIYNIEETVTYLEFQFFQNGKQVNQLGTRNGDYVTVRIPDDFLKVNEDIKCYIYFSTKTEGKTLKIINLQITNRDPITDPQPDKKTESLIGEIFELLNNIQAEIDAGLPISNLDIVMSDTSKNGVENNVIKSYVDKIKNDLSLCINDLSSTTNTKISELDEEIKSINGVTYKTVTELPAVGENNVIYLTPITGTETNNLFDEFIWIDNAYEKIGSPTIDTTDFVTQERFQHSNMYFLSEIQLMVSGIETNKSDIATINTNLQEIKTQLNDFINTTFETYKSENNTRITAIEERITNIENQLTGLDVILKTI